MILSEPITKKIAEFAPIAEQFPCVVIVHLIEDFSVVYMCSKGLKLLNITLKELQEMGTEYYPKFFNPEHFEDYLPKMATLLKNNRANEAFSYFQQVKLYGKNDWTWHITSTGIFMWDDNGQPLLTLTTAIPIESMKEVEPKAERLLKENLFLKKNLKAFSLLSIRERSILAQVALGKSSPEIADALYIAVDTVQTHRRNIKKKLNISTTLEFLEYARAFDLI